LDVGTAGASARLTHARLQGQREAELKDRWGERVGGWINRFVDEPRQIKAWGLGALGEELLGGVLANVPGLVVLNDRRVRGTKGNIDHIAIAPAGIFVIDAKRYDGFIEVVDRGSFFRSDLRLLVGGRNRSDLTEKMGWQTKAVATAMLEAGVDAPSVTPILCFIQPSWAIFRRPKSFEGVRLESEKTIGPVLTSPVVLDEPAIQRLAAILSSSLPAK
jgi:hypothetical protein